MLVTRARLLNHKSYELAEIFVSSGQLCKERRLDMTECPLRVQGLWPKGGAMAPDATYRSVCLSVRVCVRARACVRDMAIGSFPVC